MNPKRWFEILLVQLLLRVLTGHWMIEIDYPDGSSEYRLGPIDTGYVVWQSGEYYDRKRGYYEMLLAVLKHKI